MADIKVSVIIACYNGEKTLERMIDSFLRQSLNQCELILADDCSSDTTRTIIGQYTSEYPELIHAVYMEKNTKGSGVANAAFRIAKGEYVCWLDQDDWMEPQMLERLYEEAISSDVLCDYVDCDICIRDGNGKEVENRASILLPELGSISEDKRADLLVHPGYSITKIYRRQFLLDNNIWHFEYCSYDDNYFSELCAAHVSYAAKINDALYNKMARDGSTTRTLNSPLTFDRLKSALIMERELRERGFYITQRDACEFRFVELYYVNSINAFLCGFYPPELKTLKEIRTYVRKNYPDYRKNKYFRDNTNRRKRMLSLANDVSPTLLVAFYYLYRRVKAVLKK